MMPTLTQILTGVSENILTPSNTATVTNKTFNSPSNSINLTNTTFVNQLPIVSGGTGSNTAAGARTNLGATTVGANLFTLSNPSAIRFLQVNANNTVSLLDSTSFRSAIGAGTGNGTMSYFYFEGQYVANAYSIGLPVITTGGTAVPIATIDTQGRISSWSDTGLSDNLRYKANSSGSTPYTNSSGSNYYVGNDVYASNNYSIPSGSIFLVEDGATFYVEDDNTVSANLNSSNLFISNTTISSTVAYDRFVRIFDGVTVSISNGVIMEIIGVASFGKKNQGKTKSIVFSPGQEIEGNFTPYKCLTSKIKHLGEISGPLFIDISEASEFVLNLIGNSVIEFYNIPEFDVFDEAVTYWILEVNCSGANNNIKFYNEIDWNGPEPNFNNNGSKILISFRYYRKQLIGTVISTELGIKGIF